VGDAGDNPAVKVPTEHEFLTKRETAELLRVSERTVMEYVRRGALRAYNAKTGSRLRFKRVNALNVLESVGR
jgi:excisionase family DNA binding protein